MCIQTNFEGLKPVTIGIVTGCHTACDYTYSHRLCGRTVLTATGQVNGRWQILTPYRIATPELIATKFCTID